MRKSNDFEKCNECGNVAIFNVSFRNLCYRCTASLAQERERDFFILKGKIRDLEMSHQEELARLNDIIDTQEERLFAYEAFPISQEEKDILIGEIRDEIEKELQDDVQSEVESLHRYIAVLKEDIEMFKEDLHELREILEYKDEVISELKDEIRKERMEC